jgi:nucleotide-binding universal stress UspA family protein
LAQAFGSRVTLLRAVERVGPADLDRAVDPLSWQMRKGEAEAYLNEVVARLREVDVGAEKVLLEGKAAERIVEFVHDQDVELILLSSHGRSGLSGWNISSVVQKVVLRAYTTVMLVRSYRPVTDDLTGLRYKKLMVPLNGSQRAECVLPLATQLANFHQCQLLLAHVVDKPEVPRHVPLTKEEGELRERLIEVNRKSGAQYLEKLKSRLPLDVQTRLLVSEHPAEALHKLVDEEEVDIVLLSAHGYSGRVQWPYGNTTLNFIAYGTTPLLIMQDVPLDEVEMTEAEKAAIESKGH